MSTDTDTGTNTYETRVAYEKTRADGMTISIVETKNYWFHQGKRQLCESRSTLYVDNHSMGWVTRFHDERTWRVMFRGTENRIAREIDKTKTRQAGLDRLTTYMWTHGY